mgnify:CR=1 FL=1
MVMSEHLKVMEAAAAEGGEAGRWDYWGGWILPWLWLCVGVLTVNTPAELFREFLKTTMEYLTGHEWPSEH